MKIQKIALVTAILALASNVSMAQSAEKYPNNQLSLDVFGAYHQAFETFGSQFDDSWRHGHWGGGVGADFFFNKYIGVGVDSWADDKGPIFRDATGNLILRLPIGESGFAPYIFGGAGEMFHPTGEVTEDVGIGVEYRFTPHIGLFADSRYIYEEKTKNGSLARAGFRYSF